MNIATADFMLRNSTMHISFQLTRLNLSKIEHEIKQREVPSEDGLSSLLNYPIAVTEVVRVGELLFVYYCTG